MMTDISERTKVVNLLDATRMAAARVAAAKAEAKAASETGDTGGVQPRAGGMAVVDILGYESCMFAFMGAGMGAAKFTVKHGDDEANLEDADPYCLVEDTEVTATDKVKRLGYIGARRFVQVSSTVTATAAVAVLQRPAAVPKTKEPTA